MKLGQKIGIGFGIVLVILTVMVVLSHTAFQRANDGFIEYRTFARLSNDAGQIRANMLEGRLAIKNIEVFIAQNARKNVLDKQFEEFYFRFDNLEKYLEEGIQLSEITELDNQYRAMLSDAGAYRAVVDDIRSMTRGTITTAVVAEMQQMIVDKLYIIGPRMADSIEKISLDIKQEMDKIGPVLQKDNARASMMNLVIGIIAIVIGIIASLLISRLIVKPINDLVDAAEQIAIGDLSQEVHSNTNDAIGNLTNSFANMTASLRNKADAARQISEGLLNITLEASSEKDVLGNSMIAMKNNLSNVIREISDTADLLASASEEFTSISAQMSSNAEETDSQAANVSASAEETSSIVDNIAAMTEEMTATLKNIAMNADSKSSALGDVVHSIEETSNGINNVATAMEEMTSSINEVAKSTADASHIADTASRKGQEVQGHMTTLDQVVKQVSKIVDTIKDIADQTNMLALNATIEAAGAGEAGKGFAVVANEVKELARQSAEAAGDIGNQIESMLSSTKEVVNSVNGISSVLDEVAGINQSIAAAMTQQTATANEVSRTVATVASSTGSIAQLSRETSTAIVEIASHANEAATTADELSRNVSEATAAVRDIARSIEMISTATREIVEGAASTHQSAQDLSHRALSLKDIVGKFTV